MCGTKKYVTPEEGLRIVGEEDASGWEESEPAFITTVVDVVTVGMEPPQEVTGELTRKRVQFCCDNGAEVDDNGLVRAKKVKKNTAEAVAYSRRFGLALLVVAQLDLKEPTLAWIAKESFSAPVRAETVMKFTAGPAGALSITPYVSMEAMEASERLRGELAVIKSGQLCCNKDMKESKKGRSLSTTSVKVSDRIAALRRVNEQLPR